jgi:flagellar basal-body rod protein FlgG
MGKSMFIAASGMAAQQQTIDTTANNLANINTTGFKKSRANFQDLLYQTKKLSETSSADETIVSSNIQVGSGSSISSIEKLFSPGSTRATGNELDLSIGGNGFFRVLKTDGTIAYTRDGSFKRDLDGRLTTSEGLPLIPEIAIPQNAQNLNIGIDGIVSVKLEGETKEIGQIELADFANPVGLSSLGHNLFEATKASGEPIIGTPNKNGVGTLAQRQLETSNVSIIEEMVNMITGQRAYELNAKVITTGEKMGVSHLIGK